MNLADGMPLLVEATLAGSVAIVLVLLVRQRLRARFGAGIAYAGWLLVPAALLAVSLPAATIAAPAAAVLQLGYVGPTTAADQTRTALDPATVAMLLWLSGVMLALACCTPPARGRRIPSARRNRCCWKAKPATANITPLNQNSIATVAGSSAVRAWSAAVVGPTWPSCNTAATGAAMVAAGSDTASSAAGTSNQPA